MADSAKRATNLARLVVMAVSWIGLGLRVELLSPGPLDIGFSFIFDRDGIAGGCTLNSRNLLAPGVLTYEKDLTDADKLSLVVFFSLAGLDLGLSVHYLKYPRQ